MFKNDYQGGPSFEILSSSSALNWKISKETKIYDKEIKGYCFSLSSAGKMQLPKDDRQSAYLINQFLVVQCYINFGEHVSFEFNLTDLNHNKRRFILSSWNKEIKITALHVMLPMGLVRHSVWLNLCINLVSLVSDCFRGQSFRSLDNIKISGNCKIRKIFSLKSQPPDTTGEYDFSSSSSTQQKSESIPKSLNFPFSVEYLTQILTIPRLLLIESPNLELSKNIAHPTMVAFGRNTELPPINLNHSLVSTNKPTPSPKTNNNNNSISRTSSRSSIIIQPDPQPQPQQKSKIPTQPQKKSKIPTPKPSQQITKKKLPPQPTIKKTSPTPTPTPTPRPHSSTSTLKISSTTEGTPPQSRETVDTSSSPVYNPDKYCDGYIDEKYLLFEDDEENESGECRTASASLMPRRNREYVDPDFQDMDRLDLEISNFMTTNDIDDVEKKPEIITTTTTTKTSEMNSSIPHHPSISHPPSPPNTNKDNETSKNLTPGERRQRRATLDLQDIERIRRQKGATQHWRSISDYGGFKVPDGGVDERRRVVDGSFYMKFKNGGKVEEVERVIFGLDKKIEEKVGGEKGEDGFVVHQRVGRDLNGGMEFDDSFREQHNVSSLMLKSPTPTSISNFNTKNDGLKSGNVSKRETHFPFHPHPPIKNNRPKTSPTLDISKKEPHFLLHPHPPPPKKNNRPKTSPTVPRSNTPTYKRPFSSASTIRNKYDMDGDFQHRQQPAIIKSRSSSSSRSSNGLSKSENEFFVDDIERKISRVDSKLIDQIMDLEKSDHHYFHNDDEKKSFVVENDSEVDIISNYQKTKLSSKNENENDDDVDDDRFDNILQESLKELQGITQSLHESESIAISKEIVDEDEDDDEDVELVFDEGTGLYLDVSSGKYYEIND